MFYVFSTMTADVAYCVYGTDRSKDVAVPSKRILIRGGHGVATKHLYTPSGVMTEVSDEDMEILQKDVTFQNHLKNGFVKIEKKRNEPAKIAADMAEKDKSAPLTPADYEEGEKAESKSYKVKKAKGL